MMNQFQNARFKLTAWYLLIIMTISGAFSIVIYKMLTSEVDRLLNQQRSRLERQFENPILFAPQLRPIVYIDPELVEDVKNRLIIMLISINGVILISSGISGFFLAGRTLKPIEVALDEQKRFIADASHELRTPLTAIMTETEVALRDKHLNLFDAKKYLESNLEEINKLKNLTNNLLSLSRAKSTGNITVSVVNLLPLITELITRFEPLALKSNLTIENNTDDIAIQTNRELLFELLSILIDNAIKYSKPNKKIYIKTLSHPRTLDISVIDEGIGIKPADVPRIFNRFYRADSSRNKTTTDGFGLGLSIASNIAKSLKAKIHVTSTVDVGSVFIVTLPKKYSAVPQSV